MNDGVSPPQNVDGIEQLNHPLPDWWKWIFLTSLLFCLGYALYYHVGAPGRSMIDSYDATLAANTRLLFAEIGELEPNEETILRYADKPNWVRVGQTIFKTHCISCHGRDGEGGVGPNLTDDHYKYVRTADDIANVVIKGAGKGAMPPWGERLEPNEVVLISSYVVALRGSYSGGAGKAPEGNPIPAWPDPPPEPEPPSEEQEHEQPVDSAS